MEHFISHATAKSNRCVTN